ncbi:helix-turn-helix domain-containing protein [Streptomyces scabiei]|uniref:helix-turn-helix domain-containing protein n=1 Tax=Streptomyces scabiei TaxID=1930 RepID=UPI001B3436AB|nr:MULTISPECIES: helix-turn-helix domain-containing protein [Streptomyces]MBP5883144.1 transcriptional regulator [Streptomyces sp. LBUM 1487]MDX2628614.1 helix-turn-helix domain-containing protein [Streptomyces scabiei]MDX3162720.1 helix-turn-helix domain-containing protein [Streptomyces scabiei]
MRDYTSGTVLKGPDREQAKSRAAELYATGCTIRSVAAQLHRSYGGTRVLLLEAGVTLRGRGGNTRGRRA